jgi:phenylalanyl-tRNA synthetase beta chain
MSRNNNRGINDLKFFEVGNTFVPRDLPVTELPNERSKLCIGMYGDYSFFNLKGIIEQMLNRFGVELKVKAVHDNPIFHTGICAGVYLDDEQVGIFGELHPQVLEIYDIDKRVLMAELDVDKIVEKKNKIRKYEVLPKYPAMQRDIAVIVKDEVLVGDMMDVIKAVNPHVIESVELFDVYKGIHIKQGFKSTAFSIIYRHKDRTLKDKDVDKLQDIVLRKLEENFEAVLRQ